MYSILQRPGACRNSIDCRCQTEIQCSQSSSIVGGKDNFHPIVGVGPLGMMVQLFGDQGQGMAEFGAGFKGAASFFGSKVKGKRFVAHHATRGLLLGG